MSAQDYEMMSFSLPKTASRAGSPFLALFANGLLHLWREAKCRHHLWQLTELDDDQLCDYGIARDELIAALNAPLTQRASLLLLASRARSASL